MEVKIKKKSKILISQKENFSGDFGYIFRSSAIFWVKNDEFLKTIISFSNYWKFKNNLDVSVIINLRNIKGKLCERVKVDFTLSEVYNYSAPDEFEGSVEVEAFSSLNLRIPYAAVMAIYECKDSISMVHSYSRHYSQHEIEDKKTIAVGRESCWTVRDNKDISSFCVMHNGNRSQKAQIMKLKVRNHTNKEKVITIKCHKLEPFETLIIEPKKYFSGLENWLGGKPGNIRLYFKLQDSFTRMLCGIKTKNNIQLQVTHSNFDYSEHDTDKIKGINAICYMKTPYLQNKSANEIVIYPDSCKGHYKLYEGMDEVSFKSGVTLLKSFSEINQRSISFTREDGELPSRLVTAFRIKGKKNTVPAECSLGVANSNKPKKHFSWMLVSRKFKSQISWVDYSEIYGGCPKSAELVFKLYMDNIKKPIEIKHLYSDFLNNNCSTIEGIFGNKLPSDNSFWYLTVWCSYGGLMFFSTLEKKQSITIEHAF